MGTDRLRGLRYLPIWDVGPTKFVLYWIELQMTHSLIAIARSECSKKVARTNLQTLKRMSLCISDRFYLNLRPSSLATPEEQLSAVQHYKS